MSWRSSSTARQRADPDEGRVLPADDRVVGGGKIHGVADGARTSKWSIRSEDSILCIGCRGSLLSIGSVGSVLSIGSVGSAGSVLSIGSVLSAASVMSGL